MPAFEPERRRDSGCAGTGLALPGIGEPRIAERSIKGMSEVEGLIPG